MFNDLSEAEALAFFARYDFLDLCLLGETGTGKTRAARQIHEMSPRGRGAFVAVNCAELAASIIESELFGYEKGAFTGASAAKAGKFEAAAGGTLFLDEIGELLPEMQAKLLKVVEEKSVTRVGGTRPLALDVRVIYATHRDLSVLREDLRYRITAHTVRLKPLRERPNEILPLARLFLQEFNRSCGRTIKAEDCALKSLENFAWYGNVRELRSFVQKACLDSLFLADSENKGRDAVYLTGDFLASRLASFAPERSADAAWVSEIASRFRLGESMDEYFREIETHLLRKAMRANNYNQTHAARDLGLSRTGLIKKLKRINPDAR